jgi:DNA polymerase III epsilon subunit-like protein
MTDGDIVHKKLPGLYQKPYKSLCEGKASNEECTREIIKALRCDLKKKGSLAIKLAQQMAVSVEKFLDNASEDCNINWSALNYECEKLVQKSHGAHYLKELILRAQKSLAHNIRYGNLHINGNFSEKFVYQYMMEVYKAEFKERIPLTSEHYERIRPEKLYAKIEEAEKEIDSTVRRWAKIAIKDETFDKIRLPKLRHTKEPDMNEDLLCPAT